MEQHNPDVFLWLGDVIYADTDDVKVMKWKYQQQLSNADYLRFRKKTQVLGIWDDHDFGSDDIGSENPIKVQSQHLFLDFLQESQASPRRKQQGIYSSYLYGDVAQQVKLILLDTRYHRGQPGVGRADLLGDAQWNWLEQELKNSEAAINIIASGFSVLSEQIPLAEEWSDFKWQKKRLFKLLKKYQVGGVLFLVGDRHFSALLTEEVEGQVYHELMSSGLSHYLKRPLVSRIFRSYYGAENSYFGRNFSKITFNWESPVKATFEVFDDQNRQQLEKELTLENRFWVRR